MSFRYAVDLELADEVVQQLTSIETHLREVVVDLRWRIQRLHETWHGAAAGAHVVAHDGWSRSYEEMHEALVAMRRAVYAAHANYREAGDTNLQLWSVVR